MSATLSARTLEIEQNDLQGLNQVSAAFFEDEESVPFTKDFHASKWWRHLGAVELLIPRVRPSERQETPFDA